jgi:sRNA-binding protein
MKTVSAFLVASLSLVTASLFLVPGTAQAMPLDDSSPAARAALNRQQAELARDQLEQDAANLQAYRMALAERAAEIRHERAAHREAMAAYDAQVRHYEQAMRAWHDDVHS